MFHHPPYYTDRGPGRIRCANHGRHIRAYHATTAEVRECYAALADAIAEQQAELAAEAAAERFWEERGYWAARAEEEEEARRGVISFADAYRAACPEAFADEDVMA